jgi:hypothetical protein
MKKVKLEKITILKKIMFWGGFSFLATAALLNTIADSRYYYVRLYFFLWGATDSENN